MRVKPVVVVAATIGVLIGGLVGCKDDKAKGPGSEPTAEAQGENAVPEPADVFVPLTLGAYPHLFKQAEAENFLAIDHELEVSSGLLAMDGKIIGLEVGRQEVGQAGSWIKGHPDNVDHITSKSEIFCSPLVATPVKIGAAPMRMLDILAEKYTASDLACLKDIGPQDFYLRFAGFSQGVPGFESVFIAPHVRGLSFAGSKIGDADVAKIANLSTLRVLDLSGTAVTDQALDAVAKMKLLVTLNLSRTAVTDAGLAKLKGPRQAGQPLPERNRHRRRRPASLERVSGAAHFGPGPKQAFGRGTGRTGQAERTARARFVAHCGRRRGSPGLPAQPHPAFPRTDESDRRGLKQARRPEIS